MDLSATLNAKEAADRLGVSLHTIPWLRRRGHLHGVNVRDRIWLYPAEEVDRLADERRTRQRLKAS